MGISSIFGAIYLPFIWEYDSFIALFLLFQNPIVTGASFETLPLHPIPAPSLFVRFVLQLIYGSVNAGRSIAESKT